MRAHDYLDYKSYILREKQEKQFIMGYVRLNLKDTLMSSEKRNYIIEMLSERAF